MTRFLPALLAGLAWPSAALACSCPPFVPVGFIHTHVARLPSNARGALFLPPADGLRYISSAGPQGAIYGGAVQKILPSAFVITSDTEPGNLPVHLAWLDLERDGESRPPRKAFRFVSKADEKKYEERIGGANWKALLKAGKLIEISAEVQAATRLLRVGPVGGFKAGSHYTIAYAGESTGWSYPNKVEHMIDSAPMAAADLTYSLVADGLPQRRLLTLISGSGSCSSSQAAIVQDFHYVVPDAAKPYQHGILYFSESRAARFEDLAYQASACGAPEFGSSALGDGRELMEVPCDAPGAARTIRGWAGLLEVEDRLHRTDAIAVDFNLAPGRSCRGLGMLKEALAGRDAKRIKSAACALGGEEPRAATFGIYRFEENARLIEKPLPRLAPHDLPAASDLLALASADDPETRSCGQVAVTALFEEAPVQPDDAPELFGNLFKAELASLDSDRFDTAAYIVSKLARPKDDQARALYARVVLPALPALVDALVSGKSRNPSALGGLVAPLAGAAKPYLPALLAAAAPGTKLAEDLIGVLEQIAPGEPAYHALLIRKAADPALRESAALAYNRVAGRSHPEQALALLVEAARHGSASAVEALAAHGRAARSSMAVLIRLMENSADEHMRNEAFRALLLTGEGEPEAAAAIARALAAPSARRVPANVWGILDELTKQGSALAAVDMLMQGPLIASEKTDLASVIGRLGLPKAQTRGLLARLAKVQTRPK